MANTYTQSYFHLVFAVRHREALIGKSWKNELEMYITGIVQNNHHKMLAVGTMPDHIHILIGYNLNYLIPDLVEEIKTSSNKWVKEKRLSKFKFAWQTGYGAFTNSRSQLDIPVLCTRCSLYAGFYKYFAALLLKKIFRCSAPLMFFEFCCYKYFAALLLRIIFRCSAPLMFYVCWLLQIFRGSLIHIHHGL